MPGRTNLKRSDHEFVTYFGLLTAFLFHSKPLFPLFTLFTFHTDAPYHHAHTSVYLVYLFTFHTDAPCHHANTLFRNTEKKYEAKKGR